jgi:autotransporter-associated beta strand protein
MRSRRHLLILAAAATAGLVNIHTASAATHTWTGASDNNWSNAANWTSNVVPSGTGEDVFLVAPSAQNLSIAGNTGTFTVRTLTFNANAGTSPVTLNLDNAHTFTIQGTTGDDLIVQAGAQTIAGTGTGVELKLNNTDINIADGASLTITARLGQGSSSNSYNKNGNGTLILNANNGGSGGWNFTGGTFNVNAGVVTLANNGATGNSGDRFAVNNGGTLELKANYGSSNGNLFLNDGGTLRSTGGNRSFGNSGGSIILSGNAKIDVADSTLTIAQDLGGAGGFTKIGAGTLVLNDSSAATSNYTGSTTVSAGTLALSATGSSGNSAVINVQSGAAFNVMANTAYAPAANQTLGGTGTVYGAVTLSNAGSTIAPGLVGTVGVLTLGDGTTASPLTLNGGRVHFDLSSDATNASTSDRLVINGDLNLNGATRVAINRLGSSLQSNSTYTLMTYTGNLNGSASNLVLPIVRQGLSIVDPTTTPGQIQLSVGSGSAANLTWVGDNSANLWQANGATNWSGAPDQKYFDWDNVTFDDTGSNNPNVTINDTLVPNSITLNNATKTYTFSGSGTLTNVNSVVKNGAAAATFGNSGVNLFNALTVNAGTLTLANDNVGAGTINSGGALTVLNAATFTSLSINPGGTLTVGDGATSGTGSISGNVTNNGTVVFNRPDDFAQTTVIAGSGAVVKNGNGVATISANSSYTGPTFVNGGTAHPTISTAFGSATAGGTITVATGAVIDVGNVGTNSLNFGPRLFVVSGNGTGSGVLVNNSTGTLQAQQNAFQKVQLAGDATFGGTARFDVRANQVSGVNAASLDLAGHTLTKAGNMQLSLVAADVSAGNIVVTAGTLSVETTTKIQGADGSNGSINLSGDNTALQVFGNTDASLFNRPVFFNGNGGTINEAAGGTPSLIGGNITLNQSITVQTGTGTMGNLTLAGNVSGAGGITKSGINVLTLAGSNTYTGGTTLATGGSGTLATAGTLVTNTNFSNGTLTVNSGLAKVAAQPSSNSKTGLTVIPAVQVNGGSIDLTNNALVVDYTPGNSPLSQIRGYIQAGYNGGAWNGNNSIASSSAAASPAGTGKTALGYAEASALGITSVAGVPVDDSSVVVKYTLAGDANLDGVVNALDFNAIATNFGQGANLWRQGDFNYDGNVDASDFTAMSQNFGQTLASAPLTTSLGSVVPEPASLALLMLGAGAVGCRRRRK